MIHHAVFLLSVLLFFSGFFPVSKSPENFKNDPPSNLPPGKTYEPEVSKLVFIVIDALRLDFVNTKLMPLTSRLIRGNGCFNNISVQTPTVTMPRIKALTAGSVPQFIDIVLNLASTEPLTDSLIHSAYKSNKKIIFYGDDTWLKLFPSYFWRYEGTSSFYVRDFEEVDYNVTRNVLQEIERNDWDIMILHYLGLDHIGHVYGPFSTLIPQKLREMDEIIHKIYTKMIMKYDKPLVIVTGDHGMKDSGGHGGSTYAETNVPLIALGRKCIDAAFLQTDIPINLAILLGVNIPSTAIGMIQNSLLEFPLDKHLYVLYYNLLLLRHKTDLCEESFLKAYKLHQNYLTNRNEQDGTQAAIFYKNCTMIIVNELTKAATQNYISLVVSLVLMFCSIIYLFKQIRPVVWVHYYKGMDYLLALILLQPFTFLSSSYVEEEHEFWFFASSLLYLLTLSMSLKRLQKNNICYSVVMLVLIRFLRNLNSTGDKWASYPDFSDWLMKPENFIYHQLFFLSGLILLGLIQCCICHKTVSPIKVMFDTVILSMIFFYKISESNVTLGRLIWCFIFCHLLLFHRTSKVVSWTHVCALLLKPYNVFMLPCCIALTSFFCGASNKMLVILSHVCLGNMLYFAQGHSNSLASVDISVGYVGLKEYNPLFVTAQVLFHTYAFPVLCHLLMFSHMSNYKGSSPHIWNLLFFHRLYIMFIVSLNTLFFRNHLFIWSVFAPKLFIECIHSGFLFLEHGVYVLYENFVDRKIKYM
nr:unnamed protein product [Callosobruchus analis]